MTDIGVTERLARIDLMLADIHKRRMTRQQEIELPPWLFALIGMALGAALFAIGGAVGGLLAKSLG